jgi:hypothetical protein
MAVPSYTTPVGLIDDHTGAEAPAFVLADGGYQGTSALIPHRRRAGLTTLAGWKERDNTGRTVDGRARAGEGSRSREVRG